MSFCYIWQVLLNSITACKHSKNLSLVFRIFKQVRGCFQAHVTFGLSTPQALNFEVLIFIFQNHLSDSCAVPKRQVKALGLLLLCTILLSPAFLGNEICAG
jgi:hypothetical protein